MHFKQKHTAFSNNFITLKLIYNLYCPLVAVLAGLNPHLFPIKYN